MMALIGVITIFSFQQSLEENRLPNMLLKNIHSTVVSVNLTRQADLGVSSRAFP